MGNRTYAQCLAAAIEIFGEEWYKVAQITWTGYARTHEMWVLRGVQSSRFALRRVP